MALKLVYVFGQGMVPSSQTGVPEKKDQKHESSCHEEKEKRSKKDEQREWSGLPSRIRQRPTRLKQLPPTHQLGSVCLVEEHLSSEILAMSQEPSVRYGQSSGLILLPDPDQMFVSQFLVDGNEFTQKHLLQECHVLEAVRWPSTDEPWNPHVLKPKQMIALSIPCGPVTYLMVGRVECKEARVGGGGVEFIYTFADHLLHVRTNKETHQVQIALSHPGGVHGKDQPLVTCSSVFRVVG